MQTLLSTKHSISRLEHVWHVNSAFSISALKDTIITTLKEYFSEGNVEEAIRCLKELEAPHFLHEAVYRALVLTIETWPDAKKADLTLSLLTQLQAADVIGRHQTAKGFSRCEQSLPDLLLDAPAAKEAFAALQERAASSALLC
jgi:programmed cell death protein 4